MTNNKVDYSFIKFPRALVDSPEFSHISIEARTLLALILDRSYVSEKNSERFTDESGRVYVIYTIEEISEKFGYERKKAMRILKELEDCGMIAKRRSSGRRPSKIYLTDRFFKVLEKGFAKYRKSTLQSTEKGFCKVPETDSSNNKSNNNLSNNNSSIIGFGRSEDEIREQIEYESIVSDSNKGLVDEIVMIISDVLNGTAPFVRIGKDDMPRGLAVSRFCRITADHVVSILWELERSSVKIRNVKPYLITKLYNAPATYEIEATADYAYHNQPTKTKGRDFSLPVT